MEEEESPVVEVICIVCGLEPEDEKKLEGWNEAEFGFECPECAALGKENARLEAENEVSGEPGFNGLLDAMTKIQGPDPV